jgi:hypothetical protein
MERIVHKSNSFKDAEAWDIIQQTTATAEERLKAAEELKRRYFGSACPDVRDTRIVVIKHER